MHYYNAGDKSLISRSSTRLFATAAGAALLLLGAAGSAAAAKPAASACAGKPEVRFYHWAWNAQMGMILSNGGKQSTPDSAMCKHGVNLKLIREDNTDQMAALMATFA